jgi:TonB family protein
MSRPALPCWFRCLPLLVVGSTLAAQGEASRAAWLEWPELQMVIAPDPAGTFLWLNAGRSWTQVDSTQSFSGFTDPANAREWVANARAFLKQRLAGRDTGDIRASAVLTTTAGHRIFLVRRRYRKEWTHERFIAFEGSARRPPILLSADPFTLRDFLDSLESVSRRTRLSEGALRTDSVPMASILDDASGPAPMADNLAPEFPARERNAGTEGSVLVSFIVRPDGTVDTSTIKVLYSRSPAFVQAIMDVLPHYRFRPGQRNGQAVPMRLIQPFMFSLTR